MPYIYSTVKYGTFPDSCIVRRTHTDNDAVGYAVAPLHHVMYYDKNPELATTMPRTAANNLVHKLAKPNLNSLKPRINQNA